MQESFRVLDHTADVGFEAFGSTREELFANAARALMSLFVDLESVRPQESTAVRAEARDEAGLLVNWLSEILYLEDTEKRFFRDFQISHLTERAISSVASGETYDRNRHSIKMLVKAITYHQLVVERTPAGWRAQVYVDI